MNIKFFDVLRAPCPERVDAEVEKILEETLIRHLPPCDRLIVSSYYGIGVDPVTRAALAKNMNLSYDKVGEIRKRAVAKLRQPSCREPLVVALEEYVSSLFVASQESN
ncbi:MAG: hypothetical protein WAW13_00240 [Minisyncoccia bacterium]